MRMQQTSDLVGLQRLKLILGQSATETRNKIAKLLVHDCKCCNVVCWHGAREKGEPLQFPGGIISPHVGGDALKLLVGIRELLQSRAGTVSCRCYRLERSNPLVLQCLLNMPQLALCFCIARVLQSRVEAGACPANIVMSGDPLHVTQPVQGIVPWQI